MEKAGIERTTIIDKELNKLGIGRIHFGQKLYLPKNVMTYLELEEKDQVEYYQILHPDYKNIVIIKKIVK